MYRETTRAVRVTVTPEFLPGESQPEQSRYCWSYTIEITNMGLETVQLLTRHWQITDASGHSFEVNGDGVVGKQPVLRAGETFTYSSGVPLATPSGVMRGRFHMRHVDGDMRFDVTVPAFSLDSPHERPVVN
ncbi:MAG: Co2+/Mg2+ efflux protein ApaG [Flavobacteriaceae bacterium]